MADNDMNKSLSRAAITAFALLGWLLAGAIHEMGHAGAAILAGLEVTKVQPWMFMGKPHVQCAGTTSDSWWAFFDAAGMLLTVSAGAVGVVIVSFISRRIRVARRAAWLFVPMMCQCLAWVGLPLAIVLGASAPNDDIAKFIRHSGWNPGMVSLVGLCLAAVCSALLFWTYRQGSAYNSIQATPNGAPDG